MRGVWQTFFVSVSFVGLMNSEEGEPYEDEPGEADNGIEQDALTSEQMRGMHKKIDQNSDGKVSLAEVMKFSDEMRKRIAVRDIGAVLGEIDSNKDGKLSLDELLKDMEQWGEGDEEDKKEAEARKELEKAKFKVADENQDGLLDIQELPSLFYPETHDGSLELTAKSTMKQKDLDGDGVLTAKEFWEGDVVEGEDISISDEEQADFRKLDKNGDSKLSLEELKLWESGRFHTEEAMKKLFEIADKDSDMHVTSEELDAAREQIAASDAHYHLMEWAEHHEL